MNGTGKMTLLMPYYRAPLMLERHFEEWEQYSPGTKAKLRIILVDDGSPEPMKVRDVKGLEIRAYRVLKDIPWNKDGARNLAMMESPDEWALMTDMDHLLTAKNAKKMVNHKWEPGAFYMPLRVWPGGKKYRRHPNSFVLRREDFWKIGGYDEDWTGWYGSDKTFRNNLRAVARKLETDAFYLVHYEGIIKDASTTDFGRKDSDQHFRKNKALLRKRKEPPYVAKNSIRFKWERIK